MTIGIVFYRAISFFDGSTLRQDSVQALLATGLLFVIEIATHSATLRVNYQASQ